MAIKKIAVLVLGLAYILPMFAQAETLVRPRVGVGFTSYSLDLPYSGETAFDASYMNTQVGVTFASDAFYVDVMTGSSGSADYEEDATGEEGDFDRDDFAVTVGFALDEFSLFVGWRDGETSFTPDNPFNSQAGYKQTFEASGPFFGISASSPSGDGVFSYNVAMALLEATLTDNDTVFIPYDAESDLSFGFSAGIGYTTFVGENGSLAFKGSYVNYSYSEWEDDNYNIDDLSENFFSFDVTYSLNF